MSDSPAPGTRLHPSRVAGRAVAARCVRDEREALVARGDASGTGRAVAQRWGVSHTSVDRFADPTSGYAIALGDVLALPRTLARGVLVRALGALEEGDGQAPRVTLAQLTIELGRAVEDLERDLVDGSMDSPEQHRAHLVRIGTLALRGLLSLGGSL